MEKVSNELQRVFGYARVSTPGQGSNGYSLIAQRREIKRYVEVNGMRLQAFEEDVASGRHIRRVGLESLRQAVIEQAVDLVMVRTIDRLTREPRHARLLLQEMRQNGVHLVSLRDPLSGRDGFDTRRPEDLRMIELVAMFGEWQAELLSLSTVTAHAELRRQGKPTNHPEFGFTVSVEGDMVPVPHELAVLQQIWRRREEGASHQAIANELNMVGVPSKRGGRWSRKTVSDQLRLMEQDPEHYAKAMLQAFGADSRPPRQ